MLLEVPGTGVGAHLHGGTRADGAEVALEAI